MNYFLLIIFALLPSFIWLLFYLRKDSHPESNQMVLKIFFYGMLATLPAVFIEMGIFQVFNRLNLSYDLILVLNMFVGVALAEEFLKFLVVREKVLNNPEFDEPLDAMLYMIIAGLGFAALENILVLLQIGPSFLIEEVLVLGVLRFVGAIFLHALASGTVGYFLALSLFETKKRKKLIATGLGIATVLHGFYNLSIIMAEEDIQLIIPLFVIIVFAFAVSRGFQELKEMASVCKIK